MHGTATARDTVAEHLRSLLNRLKAYVQGVADDNIEHAVAIIESAGMSVAPKGSREKPPFAVRQGPVSGTVLLIARAIAKVATYFWQMSEDDGKTWIDLARTLSADTKVTDLVPGRTYRFRFRAVTRRETTDWCDPLPIIVL
jgi:hypothetical protein